MKTILVSREDGAPDRAEKDVVPVIDIDAEEVALCDRDMGVVETLGFDEVKRVIFEP